jgi:alpha-beta hydrolase superfamily lysophospholipase
VTPTLVLVHGAWHGSWCWELLVEELAGDDLRVRAVDLPSAGPALGDLDDDIATVRAAIDAADGPVVVVAHSYGGVPASGAVAGAERVRHVVYVAAFLIDAGESLLGLRGGVMPDWWMPDPEGTTMLARDPVATFYADCDPEAAAAAVARLTQPLARAGWHDHPTTYVVCDADRAIAPALQERMAARAGTVHHLPTGHSPFLVAPAAVAGIVRDVVAGVA